MATSIFNTCVIPLPTTTNNTNQLNPTVVLSEGSIQEINSYYKHLQSNLVLMSARSSVMNKEFAVKVLGFQLKWVRSMYVLSRRDILLDFVPKGNPAIQAAFIQGIISNKTGFEKAKDKWVEVQCQLARIQLSMNHLYDYASLLAKGKVIHHMLHADNLAPNQDWEPPQHMIPKLQFEGVLGLELDVVKNVERSTLNFQQHGSGTQQFVTFYNNTGTYGLFYCIFIYPCKIFLIFQQEEKVDLTVLCKAGGQRPLCKGRVLNTKGVKEKLVLQVYFWSICWKEALVCWHETPRGNIYAQHWGWRRCICMWKWKLGESLVAHNVKAEAIHSVSYWPWVL